MGCYACVVCGGVVTPEEQLPRPICAQCRAGGWTEKPLAHGLIRGLRRLVKAWRAPRCQ